MLYVEKEVRSQVFTIVDTDDNTREEISLCELYSLMNKGINLDIKGVEYEEYGFSGKKRILVTPYNYKPSKTLIKLKILKGIDLTLDEDGYLTTMSFSGVDSNIDFRLSDYCRGLNPYLFRHITPAVRNYINLIFDDKLDIKAHAFDRVHNTLKLGFTFDVTGFCDKNAARFYNDYQDSSSFSIFYENTLPIQDNGMRINYYIIEHAIKGVWRRGLKLEDYADLSDMYIDRINKAFEKPFNALRDRIDEFALNSYAHNRVNLRDREEAHEILWEGTSFGGKSLFWFLNYIYWINKSPEYYKLYLDICSRYNKLFDAGRA